MQKDTSSSPSIVISINELLSISIQLVYEAIKIIHEVQSTNTLNESWKGKNDPLTLADIKSQTLILKGLAHYFPQIKIVAEEDEVFPGALNVDFTKFQRKLFPEDVYSDKLTISQEELTAFIDPLDGTWCYVCGDLHYVTVLVGYAIKTMPSVGIMGRIWSKDSEGKLRFDPGVYFCYAETHKMFLLNDFQHLAPMKTVPIEIPRPVKKDLSKEFVVVFSLNRMNEILEKNIEQLKPTRSFKAGATGYKCLCLILGLADCYFYEVEKQGTKRWDTCVGEAFIRCFDGILCGKDGKVYDYSAHLDPNNLKGVVAMLDTEKMKEIIDITSKMPYDSEKIKF